MIFKPLAAGFHEHADLGSLDAASTVDSKVKRAKELGRIADCITDHGTLSSVASQWKACQKHGLKCIHGIEAYVQDPFNPTYLDKRGRLQKSYAHLTIHFKTQQAYLYFCSLTPKMEERAVVRYGERKPILLLEELEPMYGQIVLGSGCLVGCCMKYLKDNEVHKTISMYERLRNLAGPGNFFVELFPHKVTHDWQRQQVLEDGTIIPGGFVAHECMQDGMPHDYQKKPNQFLLELARQYKDPVIISEDSHFSLPSDKIVQDSKLANSSESSWKFYNSLHMLSSDEAAATLKDQLGVKDRDIEEFIDNSYQFVELFKDYKFSTSFDQVRNDKGIWVQAKGPQTNTPPENLIKGQWHMPTMKDVYTVREGETTKDKLKELIKKHGKFPKVNHPRHAEYVARLKEEVAILADNGKTDFLPYFFVIEDICAYCTKEGMLYNARGSAGGSLILFLLGCSITDPIRYGLSFARFMTLGRILSGSWPDVDMDFSDQLKVFDYCRQKHGDKFIRISIHKPLKVKSSIKDIERGVFGKVRPETEAMTKAMPSIPQGVTDMQWLFGFQDETTGEHVKGFIELNLPEADTLRKYKEENQEIWSTVIKCLGVEREKSVHACGAILAPVPIQSIMPTIQVSGQSCTAFGPKDVDYIGGIKFDLLGVKHLKALEIIMALVNEKLPQGQKLTWREFDEDSRVFTDILGKLRLKGLFQVNTNSMKPFVQKLNLFDIVGISNLLALVRPGALDAASPIPDDPDHKSAADYFASCSNGKATPYFIHPSLEPILKHTFGVCLMQEQQIAIAKMILDLSDEKAEEFRRATGKKDKVLMIQKSLEIMEGCKAKGWTDEQGKQMADVFMAASRYSFNLSHSLSYALVTYNGAWLKVNYPLEFAKGMLTAYGDDRDDMKDLLEEFGPLVLPVDVMHSQIYDWTIENEKFLRPPLTAVKSVGAQAAIGLRAFLDNGLATLEKKEVKIKEVRIRADSKPRSPRKITPKQPTELAFGEAK